MASRAPAQLVAALRHLGSSWTREPVSPSLAGGFFTTGPLGKALHSFFFFFPSHIRTQTQKAETPNQLVYFFLIKMKESSNQEIPTPAFFLQSGAKDIAWTGLPGGSVVTNLPAEQEMQASWVRSLGREDPRGGGHGHPEQYSCLGNPRDGGAWWAAVCGVAETGVGLSERSRCLHAGPI